MGKYKSYQRDNKKSCTPAFRILCLCMCLLLHLDFIGYEWINVSQGGTVFANVSCDMSDLSEGINVIESQVEWTDPDYRPVTLRHRPLVRLSMDLNPACLFMRPAQTLAMGFPVVPAVPDKSGVALCLSHCLLII